ncbi:hypothetical protein BT69DRAFT_1349543 [Atractiella rhizophila]|nr:hypothetical protein BT69DRAFT_1349543 [Atractiella rhizophila]
MSSSSAQLHLRLSLSERIKTLPRRRLSYKLTDTQKLAGWQPYTSPYKKPTVLTLARPGLPEKLMYCPQLTEIARKRFHDYLTSYSCPWIIDSNAIRTIDDALLLSEHHVQTQELCAETDVRPVFNFAYGFVLGLLFRVMGLPTFLYKSSVPVFKAQDGRTNGLIAKCQFTVGGTSRMSAEELAWLVAQHYLERIVEAARSQQPVVVDRQTKDETSIVSKVALTNSELGLDRAIVHSTLQFIFLKKITQGNTTYFAVSDVHHSERDPIFETLISFLVNIPDDFGGKSFDDLIVESILAST